MGSISSLLPVAGTIGGALLGGPAGAAIGGAAGGALAGIVGGGGPQSNYHAGVANIQSPVTAQQATDQNARSQQALNQQQQFVNALQAQNGLQNQSSVFNQFQGVANGTGPNPAQAMLAQATGNNVANQAALMAGQRGSSANVGLIARQAAMRGANTQQQAAGQAASLQAQQSLGALNQMGGIANQQAAQLQSGIGQNTGANQNQQGILLNSIGGVNNANVGMQSNINNVDAGISQHNSGQAANLQGNVLGAIGSAANLLGGSNSTQGSFTGDLTQGGYQAPNFDTTATATGGGAGGLGSNIMMATGGAVQGPQSKVGQHFATGGKTMLKPMQSKMAEGGPVQAMVSPGEVYLPPQAVTKVAKGADPIAAGEKIPGKAKVKGNSYANDTVPATLEEGGIVLPRSVMESKNPHWAAHKFVMEVMAKQGKTLPKKG